VAWVSVDGDVIALADDGRVQLISGTGALLWQLFDGEVTVNQLAMDVSAVFGIDVGRARQDVTDFAERMISLGLLARTETDGT
jgi:hypothetical protein